MQAAGEHCRPVHQLLADIETPNDIEIALRIDPFQVIQQTPAATDHHQQTAPAGVVLLVRAQVLGDVADREWSGSRFGFRASRYPRRHAESRRSNPAYALW